MRRIALLLAGCAVGLAAAVIEIGGSVEKPLGITPEAFDTLRL